MALEGETEDLSLGADTASDATQADNAPSEPQTVEATVREAYELAREKAEAGDDPAKLEAIRVKRDRGGRFEKRGDNAPADKDASQRPPRAQQTPDPKNTPAQNAPVEPPKADANQPLVLKAPPGWSAQARTDYLKLPLHIQQAVAQRELEVNQGLSKLAEFKGMEEHLPIIKQSGLSAAQFTSNAIAWERSLKTNPVHTIMEAGKQGGVDMVRLAYAIVNDHQRRNGQQPQPQGQPQRQQPQPQVNIDQLIDRRFAAREQAAARQNAETEANAFLNDPKNVHVDAVVDHMAALIQSARSQGKTLSLKDAYDQACWANPEIRDLLIKQRAAPPPRAAIAHQARQAARATTGAPSARISAPKVVEPHKTVRDTVRAVYQQALEDAE